MSSNLPNAWSCFCNNWVCFSETCSILSLREFPISHAIPIVIRSKSLTVELLPARGDSGAGHPGAIALGGAAGGQVQVVRVPGDERVKIRHYIATKIH